MPKLRTDISGERLRALVDAAQTLAWANLQEPFDPRLQGLDETTVETATVGLLAAGMLEPEPS